MTTEPRPATPSRATVRRTLLISGGFALAFGLYLLAFLVPDVLATASGPQRMTLAQAAEIASAQNTYAIIEDGEWDCDTIVYVRGQSSTNRLRTITRFTEVFLTGGAKDNPAVMLARLSGEVACGELSALEPTGYLTRMSADRQQELTNEARLARFFNATEFLEFCAYCGTDNSLIGTVAGLIAAAGGAALLVWGLRMRVPAPDLE